MHELSVVIEIFQLVEEIMEEQQLKKVAGVTIDVGELSGILPDYFKECWKVSRVGSVFEDTQLVVNYFPAIARCSCGCEYEMTKNSRICPNCRKTDYDIIDGKEFTIREIKAY